jgi:hypothetical protein
MKVKPGRRSARFRGPDRDHRLRSPHCEHSQGENRQRSQQASADFCRVHTSRRCCKTFRCRVALPFPVATIRAPYGFVVASLLVVLVCFSRVPCLVRNGALPNPHSVAPFGHLRPSLFTGTPEASLSGRSVRLAANLSGFIAAATQHSQGTAIESMI